MSVITPEVRRELHRLATEPCSQLRGLENFVPYVATAFADPLPYTLDDSPTANEGRYSYDRTTQLVSRDGKTTKAKRKRKREVKLDVDEIPFANVDWGALSTEELAGLVAALPAERMTMVEAARWLKSNTPTDGQWALIKAVQPLGEIIALQTGVGRYRLHIDEAKSTATDYLIRAVVCGACDEEKPDPKEFIESRIRNGLYSLAKKQERRGKVVKVSNRTVENMNDQGEFVEPDQAHNPLNDLVGASTPRRVDSKGWTDFPRPPLGTPEREAFDAAMDALIAHRNELLAKRDEKTSKRSDVWDEDARRMLSLCELPMDYTIVCGRLTRKSWKMIAKALGRTVAEVKVRAVVLAA